MKFILAVVAISIIASTQSELSTITFANRYPPSASHFNVTTANSIPDLTPISQLNGAKDYCRNGGWITYFGVNYTEAYSFTNSNLCASSNGKEIKSVRRVGPEQINGRSITLFTATRYEGLDEIIYTEDNSNIIAEFKSLIGTGDVDLTLYFREQYQGLSICVQTDQPGGLIQVPFLTEVGLEPGQVKSIKFGCLSKNIIKSSPGFMETENKNAQE